MSDLARTQEIVGGLLTEIGMQFEGSPKLTVIVRPIGFGDADFILTNDMLDEAIMLAALEDPARHLRWWIGNGGGKTLRYYGYQNGDQIEPLKLPDTHIEWLLQLPVTHQDAHRIFVHAGVPFDKPVAETGRDTLQWMLYHGDVEHDDAEFHADEAHVSGKRIVHGHHQSATHPLLKRHRTNLDSFAWKTGHRAIGVFDDTYPAPVRILSAIGVPA